ncbi:hypothetical protein GE09DRAFT_1160222 [Coniochaeta sp. 2T2.1]|nr:hypothetical protein GE09DRAFT_1160222 [Coniochaeta sp. 2T2.1]
MHHLTTLPLAIELVGREYPWKLSALMLHTFLDSYKTYSRIESEAFPEPENGYPEKEKMVLYFGVVISSATEAENRSSSTFQPGQGILQASRIESGKQLGGGLGVPPATASVILLPRYVDLFSELLELTEG